MQDHSDILTFGTGRAAGTVWKSLKSLQAILLRDSFGLKSRSNLTYPAGRVSLGSG